MSDRWNLSLKNATGRAKKVTCKEVQRVAPVVSFTGTCGSKPSLQQWQQWSLLDQSYAKAIQRSPAAEDRKLVKTYQGDPSLLLLAWSMDSQLICMFVGGVLISSFPFKVTQAYAPISTKLLPLVTFVTITNLAVPCPFSASGL